jgi:hypothetical protein
MADPLDRVPLRARGTNAWPALRLGSWAASTVDAMSIMKKLAAAGVAKKVIDEARKPQNQAKAKAAVQKLKDKRGQRPR